MQVPRHIYDRSFYLFGTVFLLDCLNALFLCNSAKLDFVLLPALIKGLATTTNLLLSRGWGILALSTAGRV